MRDKRISRSWKDNTKARNVKRYGKRNTRKYDTVFMLLDEQLFGREDDE